MATTLPVQPESPPLDAQGNLRPEWKRYLAALDTIVRQLKTAAGI